MEDKKKTSCCCSCEAGFKEEIKNLEDQAQAPTQKEHDEKHRELDEAFEVEKEK